MHKKWDIAGAIVSVALLSGTANLQAADYDVDAGHSFVEFRVQHLGYSWLYGRFNEISGEFSHDANNASTSNISVTINTASVDTNHAKRDKHLRGSDFLEVDKYPEAKFVSTGYSGDANSGVLDGTLTLHGVTKPIKINVTKLGEGKDPWGGYRAGFAGTITLNRKDFGMDFDLGPASNTLEMELGIEGIRKK